MNKRNKWMWHGVGIAALTFIFYISQAVSFVYPNEWAAELFSVAGLEPFRSLSHPVWQFLMMVVSDVSGTHIAAAVYVFNVLCGTAAVLLTYELGLRLRRTSNHSLSSEQVEIAQRTRRVAGMVSAAFFAVCTPCIVISTRVHPVALDISLLLASALMAILYRDHQQNRFWLGFAALYGIGMSESSTFILLSPFFLLWWVWLFWRSKQVQWRFLIAGLVLFGAGCSISLISCWVYKLSPIAEWREFDSYWMVMKFYLIEQYQQIRYSVPKQGWLIVLLIMILPAFFIYWNGFEEADDLFTNIGLYFFRFILVVVAVILLYNLPGSPWKVMGPSVMLATPYAITALWAGQLAAFFYEKLSLSRQGVYHKPISLLWPRRCVLFMVTAGIIGAGYINMASATPRHARPLIELSRDMLQGLHEKKYLISNGIFDSSLKWEAYRNGQDILVINRIRTSSPVYMKYVATFFTDPALESIAPIGFSPFMDVWMTSHSNIVDELAIQDVPQIWTMQGYRWQPAAGLYIGRRVDEKEADKASADECAEFLRRHLAAFQQAASKPDLLKDIHRLTGQTLSVLANNLGYYLANQESWADARQLFEISLRYDPNNLSAIINLGEMAERDKDESQVALLKERFSKITMMQSTPLSPHRLTAMYGYARNPAMFLQEGDALIRSGMSDVGIDLIQQAISMPGGQLPAELKLAQVFFSTGQHQAGLEQYQKIIDQNPDNIPAWYGLAKSHVMLGNPGEAETAFKRLEELGVPSDQLAMERGFMQLRLGANFEAVKLFEKSMKVTSVKGPSAIGMIWAALRINNQEYINQAVDVLKTLPEYYAGQIMLYQMAVNRRDLTGAREHIALARKLQPNNVDVLEKSIQFELMDGNEKQAREHLDVLLEVDSGNAYGNYLLANIHDQNGRLDLAEAALKRALVTDRRGDSYYGMAWILEKQGRYPEALTMIDQALNRQPYNPQFIAVKGIILSGMTRYDEAEKMLNRAIELRTDREVPLFKLHLAKLYLKSGNEEMGRNLMESLTPEEPHFTRDEKKIFQDLETMLSRP